MISFGNSSGALDPIDVKKYIAHKSLFLQDQVLQITEQEEVSLKKNKCTF